MSLDSMPIIRLEVQGMKHTILRALTEQTAQVDEYLKDAVEQYCQEPNLRRVIYEQVKAILEGEIRNAISRVITYGEGRQAIEDAAREALRASLFNGGSNGVD